MAMYMESIARVVKDIPLPKVAKVSQIFDQTQIDDPYNYLTAELNARLAPPTPGSRIAITCGSRGINSYPILVKAAVDWVKSKGAQPILIPAMGSHGGATAEGQTALLNHLGVSEETMGAPILSSMETVEIDRTVKGLPVYVDKNALECDGILLLNRVKPHTSFRGPHESGLFKMMAIGLAKQKGADMTHYLRYEYFADNLIDVASRMLEKLNIIGGIATVENGYDKIAEIHVLKAEEIPEKEPQILDKARSYMSRILVDEFDALIEKEIGKSISGAGMDTNSVGRYSSTTASGGPKIKTMGVLDLTEDSHGNANGMGLADFITKRLYEKTDLETVYMNALTSTATVLSKIHMILEKDEYVFRACAKHSGRLDPEDIRLVIIKSTKELGEVYMSRAAYEANIDPEHCRLESDFFEIPFDEEGNLLLF